MPSRKFLAPKARAGNGHGYLSQPIRPLTNTNTPDEPHVVERIASATNLADEPECISGAIVDGYTELAQFQHSIRHQQAVEAARQTRPLLEAEDRIRDAERRAKQSHRNLSSEFHVMRKMLERAEKGGRKAPASLISRLERVEASLDGIDEQGRPLAA